MNAIKKRRLDARQRFGIYITLPAIFMLLFIFVFPVLYSFVLGFTDYNYLYRQEYSFVGLANYQKLLTNKGFLNALLVTAKISAGALALEMTLGILAAKAVMAVTRGRNAVKSILLIPLMVAPTVAGLLFRFIFNGEFGILNKVLILLGIIDHTVPWLTSATYAMPSIIIVDCWANTSMIFLLVYTALTDISTSILEAGRVDGAGDWTSFFRIQLPIIRRPLFVALMIRFIDVFRLFDSVYTITKGGPGTATETLSMYIYRINWTKYDIGLAAAMSYVMMLIMLVVARVIDRLGRERGQEE